MTTTNKQRKERKEPPPTNPSALELRDHLRGLGYDAKCVNGNCYAIRQGEYTHYLLRREALRLDRSGVDLLKSDQARGRGRWYEFDEGE